MTIDVEESFHPTELEHLIDANDWGALTSRVEIQTLQVLDLLASRQVTATFFILGWVAEHHPSIVRRIAEAGHEIGCHSHLHRLVYRLTPGEFKRDTMQAVEAIQSACGVRPSAYRAPSYSITTESQWALEILAECGFTHDSSIYPIAHDRYGIPGFRRHAHDIPTPSGVIHEVPIATVRVSSQQVAPIGGGGYLRLLPYRYTAAGFRRVNQVEHQPACLYFHPWEIDFNQPRFAAGVISRLRTYSGLRGMSGKIDRLMGEFSFSTLTTVFPATAQRKRDPLCPAAENAENGNFLVLSPEK